MAAGKKMSGGAGGNVRKAISAIIAGFPTAKEAVEGWFSSSKCRNNSALLGEKHYIQDVDVSHTTILRMVERGGG